MARWGHLPRRQGTDVYLIQPKTGTSRMTRDGGPDGASDVELPKLPEGRPVHSVLRNERHQSPRHKGSPPGLVPGAARHDFVPEHLKPEL